MTDTHVIKQENVVNDVVTGYGPRGKKVEPDSAECCAKEILHSHGGRSYFVKHGTAGADATHMLHPDNAFAEDNLQYKFERRIGKKHFEFKRVNEIAFNFYIKFLFTGNPSWLRQAERI